MSNSENFRTVTEQALQGAIAEFKSLLEPSHAWKVVPQSDLSTLSQKPQPSNTANSSNKSGIGQMSDVTVHKKSIKGGPDAVRATADLTVSDQVDIRDFKAVIQNPEVRVTWDRLVERASILEVLDPSTHISKLDFKLGWPASPRDCILISRVMTDDLNTLVYLATSLPRSMAAYEPAFLRPNPPYVRSHVHLFAWCIHMPLQKPGKARMSLFQRWNLKGAILSSTPLELTSLLTGLVDHTRSFSDSLPLFNAFGDHFALSNSTYRAADEVMVFEYAVLPDDDLLIDADQTPQESSLEQLEARRQAARLDRAAEILLPVAHGWDIQVKCQPASTVSHDWSAVAELSSVRPGNRICFRISHARPPDSNSLTKVTLAFRRLAGGKSLRLNQQLLHVSQIDEFTPKAMQHSKDVSLLEDTATLAAPIHLSAESASIASSSAQLTPTDPRHQAIQAQIKRSYTYFASLLQEPEAKWRHVTENRGVSIGQLDSPDRTVTIYRAIATFVGVGVWDLCSAILSPGARKVWDKTVEEVHFLSTLGELSSLLHMQFKAVWPAWPRDSVYVRTVYKSPTSIHVFSFSIEDTDLLPLIPPTPANTIRSDTVIQGWCIEALSPSTTQVTLIEQTNLRGWQTKGLVYQSMINAVASCGEFAIKSGSPPFVNRLLGAQATNSIYNHEKGSLKVEYAAKQEANFNSATSPASAAEVSTSIKAPKQQSFVECEIRCDTDTWASSLDVVVDPPPSRISCLARHRLAAGGGTWLTLEHDSAMIAHVVVAVIVRKGPSSRAKGAVFVNGARVKVDNQAMAEAEIKSLTLEKRMRSSPVPLDQLLSTSRPSSTMASREPTPRTTKPSPLSISDKKLPEDDAPPRSASSIQEKTTIPLAKDSLQPVPPQSLHQPVPPSPHAMSYALEALSLLQALHVEQGPEISAVAPGWSSANERGGIFRRKLFPSLSTTHPIARGDKIVERVTAEQMLSVLTNPSVRPAWDDRVDKASTLQSFGQGQVSTLITTKPAFLTFKGRLLHVAQVPSQITVPSASATASTSTVYLLASASAPLPDGNLSPGAINSQGLPVAKMHFEGWILETLDPYSSSSLPIPSTRTSHFSCIDWSGSIPASFAPLLNASPLRIIDSVAAQARKLSIPRSLAPPDFSQVEGPLSSDEERLCVWHIKDPSLSVHESRFITSDFTLTPSRFRLVVKLPQLENPPIDHSLTKAQIHSRTGSNPFKRQPAASTSHTPNLPRHDSQQSLKDAAAGPSAPSLKSKSSVTSIRHAAAGLSSMATSQQIRNIHDLVVAECLVAYQDFCEAGYEINISSSSLDSSSTSPDEQTTPDFDDDALAATTDLPFRVSVHEMPNLGVASAADQPAKKLHMVRVTLPTSQFTNPVADPLRDAAGRAPPQWFRRLGPSSANVLAAVVVTPLPHEESPLPRGRSDSEVTAPRPVRVLYNGSRVHVATEKDSKSIFERHEKNDWQTAATVISRPIGQAAASGKEAASALPARLKRPLAVNGAFRAGPEQPLQAEHADSPTHTPKDVLSRTGSSDQLAQPGSQMASTEEPTSMQRQLRDKSASLLGTYPISLAKNAIGQQMNAQRTFSLQFVVLVAVIAFLLGSFLRALLSPADFVMYTSHADKSSSATDVALLSALEARRWRAARRLFEIKLPGRDVILATVRKH